MVSIKHNLIGFARRHCVLAVLFVLQAAFLLSLVAALFRPAVAVTLQSSEFGSALPEGYTDTLTADGMRAVSGSFAGETNVPWMQSEALTLPTGRYHCTVQYSANVGVDDTAGSCAYLSKDGASISTSIALIGNGPETEADTWMTVGASDVQMTVYANDASLQVGMIEVHEIWSWRLYRLLRTLVLFALLDVFLMAMVEGTPFTLSVERRKVLFGLTALVALISLPALSGFISHGFDLEFHLSRISGIAAGLKAGEFPVRIYPDSVNGYGYASSVFYGDLLLYIPALLHLMGEPLYIAYNFYLIFINTATVLIAYTCFKKMFRNTALAMAGTALYVTAAYRVFNMYYRPALGECSAQTFLPLLLYGFWALLSDNAEDKQRKNAWLPLMLGFSGVIQTHIISTEIAALAATMFCIVFLYKLIKKRRLLTLLQGAVGTVLLNLWFLVPFFDYMGGAYNCTDSDVIFDMDAHAVPITKMLTFWGSEMSDVRIGAALVVGALLFAFCYVVWAKDCPAFSRTGLAALIGGGVLLFVASDSFHWANLHRYIGETLAHYLCAAQFPFRYLTIVILLLAFAATCALAIINQRCGRRYMLCCAGALVALGCVCTWLDCTQYVRGTYGKCVKSQISELSDANEISGMEYMPLAFDADIDKPTVTIEDGLIAGNIHRDELGYTVSAENVSDHNAAVVLPLTYYPGYAVTENDGGDTFVTMSTNGTVAVILAPGYHGTFELRFRERLSWRLAELVSLLFAVALVVLGLRGKRKSKQAGAADTKTHLRNRPFTAGKSGMKPESDISEPEMNNLPDGVIDWTEISDFIEEMLEPAHKCEKGWKMLRDSSAIARLQDNSVLVLKQLEADLYDHFFVQHGDRNEIWRRMERFIRSKYGALSDKALSEIIATYHIDDR